MNKHLVTFISIIALGTLLIVGWKYTRPILRERLQKGSSDASSTLTTLHIGTDNWIGYFPLCSPKMNRNLRQAGYLLRCEDDQADYKSRFARLDRGELQFAAATVDSYLLNGRDSDYPGSIVMIIDESKGGDALVARRSVFSILDDLKTIQGKKIAFTASSPSEYLLKVVSNNFGLPFFTDNDPGNWFLKTEGSHQALEKLRDGSADAAVLWEPDVSRALTSPDFVKLIGTEDTNRLIVDVLLAGRRFSIDHPEAVQALVTAYFQTLHEYMQDPVALEKDIKNDTALSNDRIYTMLNGVEWSTLAENNALWFGDNQNGTGGTEGLADAITFALKILESSGDIRSNPLPGNDPYRITNRRFIRAIAQNGNGGNHSADGQNRSFSRLDNDQWAHLKKIGTLKVEPIPFRRSTALLDHSGKTILDNAADKITRYPNFRILVEGHTSLHGDSQANLKLSAARARAVATYLIDTLNLDPNRLHAVGYGSSRPLSRHEGESSRAYQYRLSRVDISLITE